MAFEHTTCAATSNLGTRLADGSRTRRGNASEGSEIHAQISLPTPQAQFEVQRENAQAMANIWGAIEDMTVAAAAGHRVLAEDAARRVSNIEVPSVEAKEKAAAARERLAKIERAATNAVWRKGQRR